METLGTKHRRIIDNLPKAVADGLFDPRYRHEDPLLPPEMIDAMTTAAAYAEGYRTFERSFPDQRTEAVWLIEDPEQTAARWLWTGTFTGEAFNGLQANGRRMTFAGMTMYRWKDGRVVHGMSLYDISGFMRQLQA